MNPNLVGWIALAINLVVAFSGMVAFFDALRRPDDAFAVVGRGPKVAWLVGMFLSAAFVFFTGMLTLLGLIGTVAIVVYHIDQRPKLQEASTPRW